MLDTRRGGGVYMCKHKTCTQDQVRHEDMEIFGREHLSITLLRLWQCHLSYEGGQTCLPLLEHLSITLLCLRRACRRKRCKQEREGRV